MLLFIEKKVEGRGCEEGRGGEDVKWKGRAIGGEEGKKRRKWKWKRNSKDN